MTKTGDAARDDRLKAALRENLKRRKAQARARREDGAATDVTRRPEPAGRAEE